jgi:hypothetical protein
MKRIRVGDERSSSVSALSSLSCWRSVRPPGAAYSILGSTNLLDWASVGTVANTYGTVQLTDPGATNLPWPFYQAVGE